MKLSQYLCLHGFGAWQHPRVEIADIRRKSWQEVRDNEATFKLLPSHPRGSAAFQRELDWSA